MSHTKTSFKSVVLAGAICLLVGIGAGYFLFDDSKRHVDGNPSQGAGQAVIWVNDEPVTFDFVKSYLIGRLRVSTLTKRKIRDGIDELVTSELLYQEAIRRNLHHNPKLRRTVRQVYSEHLLQQHIAETIENQPISEQDIRDYYEKNKTRFNRGRQVRLADIFIEKKGTDTAAEKAEKGKKAEKLLREAVAIEGKRSGFGMLVRKHSDKHPAYILGSTGYFDLTGQPVGIEKKLAEEAFKLKRIGQVARRVVETERGFHIVMLAGKRPPLQRKFETLKRRIAKKMENEKRSRLRKDLIAEVKAGSRIDLDEHLAEDLLEELRDQLAQPAAFRAKTAINAKH
ncbi:MAG: hypothetical protein GY866_31070 [Proteobacteria bacterium]|nr:hypothetical protein [Pseudomonadota bacterium]